MKKFLIIFAWVSIVGSLGDICISLYGSYLVMANPLVGIHISVDELLKNHIGFLYWVKDVALHLMPAAAHNWVFALPALIYFPLRVALSLLIGWWALRLAAKMPDSKKETLKAGQ